MFRVRSFVIYVVRYVLGCFVSWFCIYVALSFVRSRFIYLCRDVCVSRFFNSDLFRELVSSFVSYLFLCLFRSFFHYTILYIYIYIFSCLYFLIYLVISLGRHVSISLFL